jgi:chromosome segregation ATPase
MKKFGFVVMIVVLLLGIAACDSGKLTAKETEIAASFKTQLDDALAAKDQLIAETQKKLDDALAAKDDVAEESKKKLDDALTAKDALIEEKDKLIEEGKTALDNLKAEVDSKLADKDAYSVSLETVVGKLNATIEENKTTISDLQKKLDDALLAAKDSQEKISTLESEWLLLQKENQKRSITSNCWQTRMHIPVLWNLSSEN